LCPLCARTEWNCRSQEKQFRICYLFPYREATISVTAIAAPAGLKRQLGLGSTTAAVIGGIIAVGIFLTPAGMAKALGSPFWLLLVWLVVGAMTMSGALCYGELAGRFPRAGGAYVYLLESYGPRIAFLFGWMCLLVMDPAITASLATGLAGYFGYIVPLPPLFIKFVGVAVICGLGIMNIVSIRVSAAFLRWTTWLKLGLLGFLTIWAFAFRLGSWSNFVPLVQQHPGSLPLAPALGVGVVGAFFSFGGWWDVGKIAGEVRDPGRTLPRALLFGMLAVTVVYVVVSAVFLYLVPLNKVTSDETFVAQAGEVLFGPTGGVIFAAIVIICLIGSLSALIISAPRVYYAMAQDGLFINAVAHTHPRFGTPANAIVIQAVIASFLVLIGSFEQIISYAIFIVVFFLGLTVSSLFVLRPHRKAAESVVLTPGYPVTPVVFLVLVALMLVLVAARSPRGALLGVLVVLAGLPVYEVFRRRLALIERDKQAGPEVQLPEEA
jgi:APA family basic amino acid/polyamine antiporter